MVDVAGGHVESGVTSVLTVLPFVNSKQLKVIAVAANAPLPVFPDAKTFSEIGFSGVESLSWYGFFGPKDMPNEIIEKIHKGLAQVTEDPVIAKQLSDQGAIVTLDSQSDFKKFLKSEIIKWRSVAEKANLVPQ